MEMELLAKKNANNHFIFEVVVSHKVRYSEIGYA